MRPLQLHPGLEGIAREGVGPVIGELDQAAHAFRDREAERAVPLAPVVHAAGVGAIVVPCDLPVVLLGRADLAARADVAVFQTGCRGDEELVGPAVEGVERGERRLQCVRAVAAAPVSVFYSSKTTYLLFPTTTFFS